MDNVALTAEYGVIGAGALSRSFIAQLPRKARQIGPVAGVSLRVASRLANSLRAGHAVRSADELNAASAILFHAPPDQVDAIAALLEKARIEWKDKSLIFCDCEVSGAVMERFRALGASTAVALQFGIADTIMLDGAPPALAHAHRLASELRLKAIEVLPGTAGTFAAVLTLTNGAFTPLIGRAASLLRSVGMRDKDAAHMATTLFGRTIQEFHHSGKQSWTWHAREPATAQLEAEIAAIAEPFRDLFRRLIVAGFDEFDKHPEAARVLRRQEPRIAE